MSLAGYRGLLLGFRGPQVRLNGGWNPVRVQPLMYGRVELFQIVQCDRDQWLKGVYLCPTALAVWMFWGVWLCEAVQSTKDEAYRYPLTDNSMRIKKMQKFDLRCICL